MNRQLRNRGNMLLASARSSRWMYRRESLSGPTSSAAATKQNNAALGSVANWKSTGDLESSGSRDAGLHVADLPGQTRNGQAQSDQAPVGRLVRMRNLEASLFLCREPVSARKLMQLADLSDLSETRTLIHLLNHYYDSVGRAFRVESVAGGYLLMTRPELSSWLRRLVPKKQQIRLSPPSMETLVVVAYRQPVMRSEIDGIRGVNCGEILRQLMEVDLVRISGRSEELGRPYLYSTTNRFLKHFGLNNLDELPKTQSMFETPDTVPHDPDDGTQLGKRSQEVSDLQDPKHHEEGGQTGDTSADTNEETKVKVTASSSQFRNADAAMDSATGLLPVGLLSTTGTDGQDSGITMSDDDYEYDEEDEEEEEDDDLEEDELEEEEDDSDEEADDDFEDEEDLEDEDDEEDADEAEEDADDDFDDEYEDDEAEEDDDDSDEWEEVEDDDSDEDLDDDDDLDDDLDDDDDDWDDDDDDWE